MHRYYLLLVFCCFSWSVRAQVRYAWSKGRECFNVGGSPGVPFIRNSMGNWECYGHGVSKLFDTRKMSFSIPEGASIKGINVSCDVLINNLVDSMVLLLKDGEPHGINGAYHERIRNAAEISWGNDTALWGGDWTPAAINDEDFGVRLCIKEAERLISFAWLNAGDIYVRVAYELPVTVAAASLPIVRLWPNPAAEQVQIMMDRNMQQALIRLRSMDGRLLQELRNVTGDLAKIDVRDLPAGCYFVEVHEDGHIATARLFISAH